MITKNLLVYHIYLLDFLIVILSHTTITNTLMTEMVYYIFVVLVQFVCDMIDDFLSLCYSIDLFE
jgi:hypothetical protein